MIHTGRLNVRAVSVHPQVCLCGAGVGSQQGSVEIMWEGSSPCPSANLNEGQAFKLHTLLPLPGPVCWRPLFSSNSHPTPTLLLCLSLQDASSRSQHPMLSPGRGGAGVSGHAPPGLGQASVWGLELVSAWMRSWLLPCPRRSSLGITKSGPCYF